MLLLNPIITPRISSCANECVFERTYVRAPYVPMLSCYANSAHASSQLHGWLLHPQLLCFYIRTNHNLADVSELYGYHERKMGVFGVMMMLNSMVKSSDITWGLLPTFCWHYTHQRNFIDQQL